jgi:protocatechuate 3,4-dioxygenase beta subunit
MTMKYYIILFSFLIFTQAWGQENYELTGGPCEGCEAVFEFKGDLNSSDTLPLFDESSPRIMVSGTVYQQGGHIPAKDVILYFYHTNREGIYPTRGDEKGWDRRQGYIRGWVKTDANGQYSFYTFKPASYPNGREPAHIHMTVLEPNGKYYWIDDFLFKDDPLLSKEDRNEVEPRGGTNGILDLQRKGNMLVGERDIILGENIPGYE